MLRALRQIRSKFATPLPVGTEEFEAWANDIIDLAGNFADPASLKFTLADMVQRLGPLKDNRYGALPGSVPKDVFVQALRKVASSQVAAHVQVEIKAALAAKQAEETATLQAATSDVEQPK